MSPCSERADEPDGALPFLGPWELNFGCGAARTAEQLQRRDRRQEKRKLSRSAHRTHGVHYSGRVTGSCSTQIQRLSVSDNGSSSNAQ